MPITVRSRAALRWSASLVEPLLSTTQRIQLDRDFDKISRSARTWFIAFCSGVLSGIMGSLPMSDPWRTAKVDANGVAMWPDGRTFGMRGDTSDVLRPVDELDESGIDPTTIALEQDISKDAAALLVTSFGGWRDTLAALTEVQTHHGPDVTFDTATASIRWAQHRRRAYRPEYFDSWLDFLVMGWAGGWADDVVAHGGLGDAVERELHDDARKERELLTKIADALEFFSTDPD